MNGLDYLDRESGNELGEGIIKYKVTDKMQYEHASRMCRAFTEAEAMLWEYLRNNKMGEKFRRQHPLDGFIVDFICLSKNLIIEIDGSYHDIPEQKLLDEERTKILNRIGFSVIRFTNTEILKDIKTVLQKIKECLFLY